MQRQEAFKSMKNDTFYNWHDLRKPVSAMKAKFTYKEFTLLAGILVALIIVLALWLRPVTAESSDVSRKLLPPVAKPTAKAVAETAMVIIQETLR